MWDPVSSCIKWGTHESTSKPVVGIERGGCAASSPVGPSECRRKAPCHTEVLWASAPGAGALPRHSAPSRRRRAAEVSASWISRAAGPLESAGDLYPDFTACFLHTLGPREWAGPKGRAVTTSLSLSPQGRSPWDPAEPPPTVLSFSTLLRKEGSLFGRLKGCQYPRSVLICDVGAAGITGQVHPSLCPEVTWSFWGSEGSYWTSSLTRHAEISWV